MSGRAVPRSSGHRRAQGRTFPIVGRGRIQSLPLWHSRSPVVQLAGDPGFAAANLLAANAAARSAIPLTPYCWCGP